MRRVLAVLALLTAVIGVGTSPPPHHVAAATQPLPSMTYHQAAVSGYTEVRALERSVRPVEAIRVRAPHPVRHKPKQRHRVIVSIPTGSWQQWATSPFPVMVANCESADLKHWPHSDGSRYLGGYKGIHLRDPNGHYGKWQFAPGTWLSVGGHGNPADASESEQDYRAHLLWVRDGWGQWSCSHLV